MLVDPAAIEERSLAIIEEEIGPHPFSTAELAVVKRAIHATADFDFAKNILFSPGAVEAGIEAIRKGAAVMADVQMVEVGISKDRIARFGGKVLCFMGDPDVAVAAKESGVTRAIISMRKVARLAQEGSIAGGGMIFAIGNAPTALLELIRLCREEGLKPALVIGVPVGFVSAAESKEALERSPLDFITCRGRKGGSPVAVAMVNALSLLATQG